MNRVKYNVEIFVAYADGSGCWMVSQSFFGVDGALNERKEILAAFPYALVRIIKEETTTVVTTTYEEVF